MLAKTRSEIRVVPPPGFCRVSPPPPAKSAGGGGGDTRHPPSALLCTPISFYGQQPFALLCTPISALRALVHFRSCALRPPLHSALCALVHSDLRPSRSCALPLSCTSPFALLCTLLVHSLRTTTIPSHSAPQTRSPRLSNSIQQFPQTPDTKFVFTNHLASSDMILKTLPEPTHGRARSQKYKPNTFVCHEIVSLETKQQDYTHRLLSTQS